MFDEFLYDHVDRQAKEAFSYVKLINPKIPRVVLWPMLQTLITLVTSSPVVCV